MAERLTNAQIAGAALNDGVISSDLYQEIITKSSADILNVDAMTNGFISLLNRIVNIKIYGITTANKWKKMYRDMIGFGSGLDTLVIGKSTDRTQADISTSENYSLHEGNDMDVDSLSGEPQMTNVHREYPIVKERYKISFSEEWITYAVVNQYGIDEVTSKFVSANDKAMEIDTDNAMFEFIRSGFNPTNGFDKQYVTDNGTNNAITYVINTPTGSASDADLESPLTNDVLMQMITDIHNVSSDMAINNTGKYSEGVEQNVNYDKQLLIIDYHIYNLMKTRLYSGAFNLSELKIPVDNIILIDMGFLSSGAIDMVNNVKMFDVTQEGSNQVLYGILVDEERYQIRDKLNVAKSRVNEGGLFVNMFRHIDRRAIEVGGRQIRLFGVKD